MKPSIFVSAGALAVALALPVVASAQQYPAGYPQQGYPQQGYPQQQAPGQQGQPGGPGVHQYNHWMKILGNLNLSQQQQQQIQGVLMQYAQAHPAGSQRDPQGMHALRQQIFGLLSPQQQGQLQQEMQAMRQQRMQQRQQRMQQQGQLQQQQPQVLIPPQQQQPPQPG